MGANSEIKSGARKVKKNLAAAVVQLDGSVLIWHMIEWVSTACCLYLYAARSKNENRAYQTPNPAAQLAGAGAKLGVVGRWALDPATPRTRPSPTQLLAGPRGLTAANITASGPSDRAAGLP
jgi:hypothetical protein